MVITQSNGMARIVIALLSVCAFFLIIYNFTAIRTHIPSPPSIAGNTSPGGGGSGGEWHRPKHGGSLKGIDPLLQEEKGPAGKIVGPEGNRTAATLLALVRNNELNDMLQSMRDLEETFNKKFNYPWTFFNDEPFTAEFKKKTSEVASGECRYGVLVPVKTGKYPN
jgi:mannosyltransferase